MGKCYDIQKEPKFLVGQVVRLKYQRSTKIFIIEAIQQTCPGGTQVWYTGRAFFGKDFTMGAGTAKDFSKYQEIELEAVPEPSKEKLKLEKELSALTLKKEDFIKKQDFEKAAELREQEHKLKEQIRLINMEEGMEGLI